MRSIDVSVCPIHGAARKRSECKQCNAAYMRSYLKQRRSSQPEKELWSRARQRAQKFGLPCANEMPPIVIPSSCPVLGIPLIVGGSRSGNSPSLDRIDPVKGYVDGNVRVISDRANRLKSNRELNELRARAKLGSEQLRRDYRSLVDYVERETLLADARLHAQAKELGSDWKRVVKILDKLCTWGSTAR